MVRITCCKDCTERHPACHDKCEKYQGQKKAENDALMANYKAKKGEIELADLRTKKKYKRIKRFGKTW